MKTHIDLNADVGEGYASDAELLTLVSSANISCGAHAGSESDINAAIEAALQNNVRLGAHPSYPDRESMGRRSLTISMTELQDSLMSQLEFLRERVVQAGGRLHHIKAHGALYNDAARNAELADALSTWIHDFDDQLVLVGLTGGQQQLAAQRHGLRFMAEAFVDRAYQADGSLVPRSQPGAVLDNTGQAIQQALDIVLKQQVTTLDGQVIPLKADTLCIHGDTPNAVAFARALRAALAEIGCSWVSRQV